MADLLLVIDLQRGWWHDATRVAMLNSVELCKNFPGDIIHCCFRNDPASLFHTQLNWQRFVDDEDTAEIPEAAELKLKKYWRNTYSCLTPEVTKLIKSYEKVYIAGVFTDVSVAATAMGIFDLNVPVAVVRDCVATLHGEDIHKAALKSFNISLGPDALVDAEALAKS